MGVDGFVSGFQAGVCCSGLLRVGGFWVVLMILWEAFVLCPCALVFFLVSPWGCVHYRVTVALFPSISLWILGGVVFGVGD